MFTSPLFIFDHFGQWLGNGDAITVKTCNIIFGKDSYDADMKVFYECYMEASNYTGRFNSSVLF